jgi:hypothetical protein
MNKNWLCFVIPDAEHLPVLNRDREEAVYAIVAKPRGAAS